MYDKIKTKMLTPKVEKNSIVKEGDTIYEQKEATQQLKDVVGKTGKIFKFNKTSVMLQIPSFFIIPLNVL